MDMIQGVSEEWRRAAAEIYFEAFRRKLASLTIDRARGASFIEAAINPRRGILAVDGGRCVGVAGLEYGGEAFIEPRIRASMRALGWVRGFLGGWFFPKIDHAHPRDAIRIECLAVATDRRGQGVGRALLAAVDARAREEGCPVVTLEVVDTNPRARALYEREGFRCVRTLRYPWLRPLTGFSAVAEMRKDLPR